MDKTEKMQSGGPQAFVAGGNRIEGDLPVNGKLRLAWKGRDNILRIGRRVRLNRVTLRFEGTGSVIAIGAHSRIMGTLIVADGCSISIGAHMRMNGPSTIQVGEGGTITIGEKCLFADVLLRNTDFHAIWDTETGERVNGARDIVVGDHVWLAAEVWVLKGAQIGAGSIVGARSLVTGEIPPQELWAGSPARCLRKNVRWTRSVTGEERWTGAGKES